MGPLVLGSDSHEFAMVIIFSGMLFVFLIILTSIGIPSYTSMRSRREREQTKREIAAYVAEGSITPQEGIEMLKAVAAEEVAKAEASKCSCE